jgi:hypothetical protein
MHTEFPKGFGVTLRERTKFALGFVFPVRVQIIGTEFSHTNALNRSSCRRARSAAVGLANWQPSDPKMLSVSMLVKIP